MLPFRAVHSIIMHLICIDYKNLDNPLFLKSFAETLRQMGPARTLIVHADSAYTDRIVQTGIMREQARVRSLQDLNNRLVTFLSDAGVVCVGLNAFQRGFITRSDQKLHLKASILDGFPPRTHIVLSSLIQDIDLDTKVMLPLPELVNLLREQLPITSAGVFSPSEKDHITISGASNTPGNVFFGKKEHEAILSQIPAEFHTYDKNIQVLKPIFNNTLRHFVKLTEIHVT